MSLTRKAYFKSMTLVDISQNVELGNLASALNGLSTNYTNLSNSIANKADSTLFAGLNTRVQNIENDYATNGSLQDLGGQVANLQNASDQYANDISGFNAALAGKADQAAITGFDTRLGTVEANYVNNTEFATLSGNVANIQAVTDALPANYVAKSVYDTDIEPLNQFAEVISTGVGVDGYPGYQRGVMQTVAPPEEPAPEPPA
jgi:hypothetical protein